MVALGASPETVAVPSVPVIYSGNLIAGAQFQLTYAGGGFVDNANGHLSSNGLYTTDDKGEIRVSGVTGTIVAKEVKAAPSALRDNNGAAGNEARHNNGAVLPRDIAANDVPVAVLHAAAAALAAMTLLSRTTRK